MIPLNANSSKIWEIIQQGQQDGQLILNRYFFRLINNQTVAVSSQVILQMVHSQFETLIAPLLVDGYTLDYTIAKQLKEIQAPSRKLVYDMQDVYQRPVPGEVETNASPAFVAVSATLRQPLLGRGYVSSKRYAGLAEADTDIDRPNRLNGFAHTAFVLAIGEFILDMASQLTGLGLTGSIGCLNTKKGMGVSVDNPALWAEWIPEVQTVTIPVQLGSQVSRKTRRYGE